MFKILETEELKSVSSNFILKDDTYDKNVKPFCSIIIRCYNEGKRIERLLDEIMQQTIKDIEIIIVDSGSTDETLSIISKFPVKLVYISPNEFSFGRALNRGCEVANGDFLVFISAHCYPVNNNWLEELLVPFNDPKVALVYGKQRGNKSTKYSEQQIFKSWFPDETKLKQYTPFCNNANCAVRKTLWSNIHYDEELTGLEDLDWAKKVVSMNFYIVYSSEAEIIHIHDETLHEIHNRYRREAIALKQIFSHEKFTFWNFISLLSTNILVDCYQALKDGILFNNFSSIVLFRYMQFSGTFRGFRQRDKVSKELQQTFYYPNIKVTDVFGKEIKSHWSSVKEFSCPKAIDFAPEAYFKFGTICMESIPFPVFNRIKHLIIILEVEAIYHDSSLNRRRMD